MCEVLVPIATLLIDFREESVEALWYPEVN